MSTVGRIATLAHHLRSSTIINTAKRTMSSGNSTPRWQRAIEAALEKDGNATVYQLATLESNSPIGGPVPRVRSVIHRAFLAPRSGAHPLLLTTTDARTPKTTQLAQSSRVELAWWLTHTQEQIRILGTAYVLPAPDFALAGTGAETAVSEEQKRKIEGAVAKLYSSFPGAELGGEGFDWEKERRERFEGMSGHMRASWVRPVPGTRLVDPGSAEKWPEKLPKLGDILSKDGESETGGLVKAALRNFALVVIDPVEVDYVELGVMPNRRTRFFKEGEEWKEEAVVP